jgi:hypothetical protein
MEAMNQLPQEIEIHRDRTWHRESELRIEDAYAAEHFINALGFCSSFSDSRRAGPSLISPFAGAGTLIYQGTFKRTQRVI